LTVYVPGSEETDLKKLILSLQQLSAGRSNAVGAVTLAISSATTTVTDMNCAVGSTVLLSPTNAASSTEYSAGIWFVTPSNGSFVITHINNTTTGRAFRYAIHG
jgi:hypothetical protein